MAGGYKVDQSGGAIPNGEKLESTGHAGQRQRDRRARARDAGDRLRRALGVSEFPNTVPCG
jgi:hypothetical protein